MSLEVGNKENKGNMNSSKKISRKVTFSDTATDKTNRSNNMKLKQNKAKNSNTSNTKIDNNYIDNEENISEINDTNIKNNEESEDEESEDEESDNEESEDKESDNEESDNGGSDNEGSDNEGSDNEGSDKERSDKERSDNEGSDNEGSDNEEGEKEEIEENNKEVEEIENKIERKDVEEEIREEETVKELYSVITGNVYMGESVDEMRIEMIKVKSFLQEHGNIMGLKGKMMEIHKTIFVEELREFTEREKKNYGDIIEIEFKDDKQLMERKYRNTELLRLYGYIDSVLFGKRRAAYGGKMTFFAQPDMREIMDKGIEYYYYRVGECTIEQLMERYEFYELLHMASILFLIAKREFIATTMRTKEEMASLVMLALDSVDIDPRTILTINGPIYIHKNIEYNIYSLDPSKLIDISSQQGIIIQDYTLKELYHEYLLLEFQPTFFLSSDSHLHLEENIENNITTTGELISEIDTPIYYGIGDGLHTYQVFSEDELHQSFFTNKSFINPRTKVEFSLVSIRKLLTLTKKQSLSSLIQQLINQQQIIPIFNIDLEPHKERISNIKENLMAMFNIGIEFSDIQNRMIYIEQEDIELRSTHRVIEPIWRQKLRDNIYYQLDLLNKNPLNDIMWLLTFKNNTIHVDTSNPLNTLSGQLELLVTCTDLGLFDTISFLGNKLMITANYYMKNIFGISLTRNNLEFIDLES